MDPVTLSAGLVTVLARLIPYFTGLGGAAASASAQSAGQALGEAGVQRCASLWDRLWPRLRGAPDAREAVNALAAAPDSPDAQTQLASAITPVLRGDPDLAAAVAALIADVRDGSITIEPGTITIDGDQNVVQVGSENLSIGTARDVNVTSSRGAGRGGSH